jgi:hypothetical protein
VGGLEGVVGWMEGGDLADGNSFMIFDG